ncbi:MAG: beta-galactosidase trimerization domain-containing protein, partial [Phycisphaerae bacterium]
LNARCSVGDQLHPTGKICKHTYELIGSVFRQVEAREPWCRDAHALTDIAVLTGEDFASGTFKDLQPWLMGAVRMLQELGHQFDLIDGHADFRDYRMVILPDEIGLSPGVAERLDAYVAYGGLVIASYHSGLALENGQEPLEAMGVHSVGEAPYCPDFIIPRSALAHDLPRTEHAMYLRGMEVSSGPGATPAADVAVPYFNRTWEHFCSHRHTPSSGEIGYPGAVMTGRTLYFAHPIFSQYAENAPRWCKQLLRNAINRLMPDPLVRHDGPSSLIVSLNEQPEHKRWVLHLLHYIPERRGRAFDVVEDAIPLHDLHLSVAAEKPLRTARLVPQDEPLGIAVADGRVEISVPRMEGHQMIELSYGDR